MSKFVILNLIRCKLPLNLCFTSNTGVIFDIIYIYSK